jgi:protein-disulfide isomerase
MFPTILVFGLSAAAVAAADRAKQANQTAAVRPSSGQELQEQIVLELRAIRQILESTAGREVARDGGPPKTGKVRTAGPGLGSATAPLTLVEFSDLQCPLDLIRFGGHLSCGGYDVQTDGRHTEAPRPAAVH